MQMCAVHWAALRQAVDERGMTHLVAKSGEEAHAAMAAELQGEQGNDIFDPLMSANWMISGRFLEGAGIAGLGDCCPLCEVRKGYLVHFNEDNADREWINGCTDSLLQEARTRGLMPKVQ